MKTFTKILTLAAALAVSTSFAYADQISFDGSGTYTNNSITPNAPGIVDGTSTGLFSGFNSLNPNPYVFIPATFTTTTIGSGYSGTELFVTTTDRVDTLDFYLTGLTDGAEVGDFTGTGYFTETPDFSGAPTTFSGDLPGTITITTQGTENTTFSASAINVTPEPSGLLLLGTGLIGAAGLARRKFAATLAS